MRHDLNHRSKIHREVRARYALAPYSRVGLASPDRERKRHRTPTVLKVFFRHTSNKRQGILTHVKVKGTLVQIPNTVTSLNALHSLITLGFSYLHWNLMCTKEFRARRSFVQYFIPYYSFSKITLKTLVMTRCNIYFRSSVTFSLYWCTPLAAAKVECIPTAYLTSSERGRYCE